jgi:hypothetical protein
MTVQDTLFKLESQAKDLYNLLKSTTKASDREDSKQEEVSVLIPVPYYKSQQDNEANVLNDHRLQANNISQKFIELKDEVNLDFNHNHYSSELLSYINGGTRIVTILSSVYELLSVLSKSNSNDNKAASWIPPSSFERSTHKYWVPSNNLSEVMLKCIEEVPLLMYGKKEK